MTCADESIVGEDKKMALHMVGATLLGATASNSSTLLLGTGEDNVTTS